MTLSGGTQNDATLLAYGAKFNSLIDAGEWWRLITPIFIHIGAIHLFFNMYGLWMLGAYVERLYGSAKFVVFWIVSGVAGVVASYLSVRPNMEVNSVGRFLFKAHDGPSAGASGALFGLIGVLFVFGIKFRRELPDGFKRAFGTGMLPTILINLFIGYTLPFIDNAAHLGGLFAGAVLALFIDYKRPGERASVARLWHALQAAALALVVASFTLVARNYTGQAPTFEGATERLRLGRTPALISYFNAVSDGQRAFMRALYKENAEDKIDEEDVAAVDRAIEALSGAPPLDDETSNLKNDLKVLLERARMSATSGTKERAAAKAQKEVKELFRDYEAWQQRWLEWVKTRGGEFGLELKK